MLIDENKKSEIEFEKEISIFLRFVSSPYNTIYIYVCVLHIRKYVYRETINYGFIAVAAAWG